MLAVQGGTRPALAETVFEAAQDVQPAAAYGNVCLLRRSLTCGIPQCMEYLCSASANNVVLPGRRILWLVGPANLTSKQDLVAWRDETSAPEHRRQNQMLGLASALASNQTSYTWPSATMAQAFWHLARLAARRLQLSVCVCPSYPHWMLAGTRTTCPVPRSYR